MIQVNIAELKNRLSHYLRLVRRGTAILVRDRDEIVARLEPVTHSKAGGTDAERLDRLEGRGILRRGKGKIGRELLSRRPRVRADVVRTLLEERAEGR